MTKGESPTSLPAWRASVGSTKPAHRDATSVESSSQEAALVGTRVARQRTWAYPPTATSGTEVQEQETGGAVRPGSTSSPSSTGKGSVHSPSLASKGGAQNKWDVGFARGTRIAKVG